METEETQQSSSSSPSKNNEEKEEREPTHSDKNAKEESEKKIEDEIKTLESQSKDDNEMKIEQNNNNNEIPEEKMLVDEEKRKIITNGDTEMTEEKSTKEQESKENGEEGSSLIIRIKRRALEEATGLLVTFEDDMEAPSPRVKLVKIGPDPAPRKRRKKSTFSSSRRRWREGGGGGGAASAAGGGGGGGKARARRAFVEEEEEGEEDEDEEGGGIPKRILEAEPLPELPNSPPPSVSGCARCDAVHLESLREKMHFKKMKAAEGDVLSEEQYATMTDLEKYQHMKGTVKRRLAVGRSKIHSRGLFALQNLRKNQMVVEYVGELLRLLNADVREEKYDKMGLGSTYLFRIDDYTVIDATMAHNEGHFINHSCNPNCYAKIMTIDGKKRIIIFTLRDVAFGEELTYDYKLPFEEDKIPCLCGSRHCRTFLN